MKKYFILYIITLFSISSFAQKGSIHGAIVDFDTQEKLPFVTVYSLDTSVFVTADADGKFELNDLDTIEYELGIQSVCAIDSILPKIKVHADSVVHISIAFKYRKSPCVYSGSTKECPICKKEDEVIPISYGFSAPESFEKLKKRESYSGGCMITCCDPSWYCKRDKSMH